MSNLDRSTGYGSDDEISGSETEEDSSSFSPVRFTNVLEDRERTAGSLREVVAMGVSNSEEGGGHTCAGTDGIGDRLESGWSPVGVSESPRCRSLPTSSSSGDRLVEGWSPPRVSELGQSGDQVVEREPDWSLVGVSPPGVPESYQSGDRGDQVAEQEPDWSLVGVPPAEVPVSSWSPMRESLPSQTPKNAQRDPESALHTSLDDSNYLSHSQSLSETAESAITIETSSLPQHSLPQPETAKSANTAAITTEPSSLPHNIAESANAAPIIAKPKSLPQCSSGTADTMTEPNLLIQFSPVRERNEDECVSTANSGSTFYTSHDVPDVDGVMIDMYHSPSPFEGEGTASDKRLALSPELLRSCEEEDLTMHACE